jgi:hypothetical protein
MSGGSSAVGVAVVLFKSCESSQFRAFFRVRSSLLREVGASNDRDWQRWEWVGPMSQNRHNTWRKSFIHLWLPEL